ncbi:MAG: GrpB family protein [Lentisphaeria bacterium]|nr:GrpB family protein [Lentisphaeria bacterium]
MKIGANVLKIVIAKYNPNWILFFESEKKLLKGIFSDTCKTINHMGSTSVPGLSSKPIVDISIGVEKLNTKDFYADLLKVIGFKYQSGSEFEEWILFEKREVGKAFNLHIMPYNSKRLLDQLIFRRCLLGNGELAKDYELLKKHYTEHDDNLFYSMNKLPFVTGVVKGFKEGFSKTTECSEEQLYQYVQNKFCTN